MAFDINKGYCNGQWISGGGCEFTFHLIKHTQSTITAKSCKKCSCPLAKRHKAVYAAERRAA